MKYLTLNQIREYEQEAKELGVSEVARSSRGFLTAYKKAKGNPSRLSKEWRVRRNAFIARHLAQYKNNPTYRRRLALIMWAYDPE